MSGYNQFCPMAMAAELLCKRWNLIILRELHLGSTHFNELRRGIPKISPTLLSLRLKELKSAGIIEGTTILNGKATSSYSLTQSGRETFDVILALGNCLSPLELCQYILAKGVRKHGSKALF